LEEKKVLADDLKIAKEEVIALKAQLNPFTKETKDAYTDTPVDVSLKSCSGQ
jgi:hypothetical protein